MTSVIKVGGSSAATPESINRIIDQLDGIDDDLIVVTVSAQGNTTNRIVEAIERARNGESTVPEYVFQEFEAARSLFPGNNSRLLDGLRYSIYKKFENLHRNRKNVDEPSYTASLHLDGERLSAYVFSAVLQHRQIRSRQVNFADPEFPLVVQGDPHNARVDFEASRKQAAELMRHYDNRIFVLPGYGGIDKKEGKKPKTLGRGGSDTAAFGYLYAFQGDSLYILTDVDGILEANVEGARTVPELDISEAKDSATLGAKLPGRRALEGADKYFKEGHSPEIYIVNSQDAHGSRTSIVPKVSERMPAKLVSGRNIILYRVEGNLEGLQNVLEKSGIEFVGYFSNDYARVAIPSDAAGYGDRIIHGLFEHKNGRRGAVDVRRYADLSLVGVVGKGMSETPGLTARASYAMSDNGIDIRYNMDPGSASLGFVINDGQERERAVQALYREFIPQRSLAN